MITLVSARLSGLSIDAEFVDAEQAADTYGAIWRASSARSFTPANAAMNVRVERVQAGFRVVVDGIEAALVGRESQVCPTIERHAYDKFVDVEASQGRAILHASAVVGPAQAIVFAGVSGSGKSAMARAALAQGYRYFADEHVVTDGAHLWGVPRAIHLDMEDASRAPAPWHAGADRERYVFEGRDGCVYRIPFVMVSAVQIAERPHPLDRVVLVAANHGETDELEPLAAAERIALLERAHFLKAPGMARVALASRAYRLTWREPNEAFALLTDRLGS